MLLTLGQPMAFPRLVAQEEEIFPVAAIGPIDVVICPGADVAAFSTTALGTGPFKYQWTKDGAQITGATTSSYTVGPVNPSDAGTYCVIVKGPDISGADNSVINCATLTVAISSDTVAPILNCSSASAGADENCQLAVPNVLGGVSVSDNCSATDAIVLNQSPAAGELRWGLGPHKITVTATDGAGNKTTCTTTFTVVDTTRPSLTLNGLNPMTIATHAEFIDPGASAIDNCDGDLTSAIQVSGTVDVDTPGTYTVTYRVSDSAGNISSASRTVNVSGVRIREIQLNQAVDAPDIDLDGTADVVAGRPMLVRVLLDLPTEAPDSDTVQVELSFQGQTRVSPENTMGRLRRSPAVDFFVTPALLSPPPSTAYDVVASIPSIRSSIERRRVSVKSVRDVRYRFVPIRFGSSEPANFSTSVQQARQNLEAVFPISPSRFEVYEDPLPRRASNKHENAYLDAIEDTLALWRILQLSRTPFMPERIVGIVTQDWCSRPARPPIGDPGMTFHLIKQVAFAKEGEPWTPVHELGHTYGLGKHLHFFEDYNWHPPDGFPAESIWHPWPSAVWGYPLFNPPKLDYMGVAGAAQGYWTTPDHFASLFREFVLAVPDPEVLLVTGTISQNGQVTWGSLDRSLEGVVDHPDPGNAAIPVLDVNGVVLSETPFGVDFSVIIEPHGAVETDVVPFAFSVPYPPTAVQVEVVLSGEVLARRDLRSGLLVTAIASIPDRSFIRNPEERRQALLYKVEAFQAKLSVGDVVGATNKLRNDIRWSIEHWLLDGYLTISRSSSKTARL